MKQSSVLTAVVTDLYSAEFPQLICLAVCPNGGFVYKLSYLIIQIAIYAFPERNTPWY